MIAYILSNVTLKIQDLLQYEQYSFSEDIECGGKSSILVTEKPNVRNDDFIVCVKENGQQFFGICESYSHKKNNGYTVTMKEAEALFDRQIFVGNEALISSTGLEDFIRSEIIANWVDLGDTRIIKNWLTVQCDTHTKISAKASSIGSVENGVYNLKTFIGNCMERYGVVLEYVFDFSSTPSMTVHIKRDSAPVYPIDVELSDVADPVEDYSVDVLAKLNVKWLNTTTSQIATYHFYLLTDRSITTNMSDPNRADGTVKAIYVEAETYAEMYENVVQEFSNNSYQHKITLKLLKGSRAYPEAEYYVGRKVRIKTVTGIRETIVTGRTESNNSGFVQLVFGKLKVTLIEKLRSR